MAELAAVAPDGRRERWAEHRAQRRRALVQAGVEAVDRFPGEPSIDAVAEVAGVSRTVLYRYFADLDELHQAVETALTEDVLARVLQPLSELTTAREIIANIVEAVASWVEQHPRGYQFLRRRSAGAGPAADAVTVADSIQATVADRLAALLTMFMTAFGMRDSAAELGARSLVGLVESSVHWWSRLPVSTRLPRAELVLELTVSVWAVIEVHLAAAGVALALDDPLPDLA